MSWPKRPQRIQALLTEVVSAAMPRSRQSGGARAEDARVAATIAVTVFTNTMRCRLTLHGPGVGA